MRLIHKVAVTGLLLNSYLFNSVSANELSGNVSIQARMFAQPALSEIQDDHNLSAALDVEFYHDFEEVSGRFVIQGFVRADSSDSERSHSDIRELYYWHGFDDFEVYAGIRKVFWGVTETVHLVDVVNQDDAIENLDGEDKLGQPMISVSMDRDWGTLEAYALLGFRERTFAGENGRLRPDILVNQDRVLYESDDKKDHVDFAVRWSHVIGDWDVGLSHFSGTSRDPILSPMYTELGDQQLQQTYLQIDQTGVDLQATLGDWAWKLEAISIEQKQMGRKTALVGGFEYTLFGIAETAIDLGLLLEYHFDDRNGIYQSTNQNDIAFGFRFAFNDVDDSSILFATSVDLDNDSQFYSFEANTRLSDRWSVAAEARVFSNTALTDPAYSLRDEDYFEIDLKHYF